MIVVPLDDHPSQRGYPIIISESATHIIVAVEITKTRLHRHRRFLEMLVQAATPAIGDGK